MASSVDVMLQSMRDMGEGFDSLGQARREGAKIDMARDEKKAKQDADKALQDRLSGAATSYGEIQEKLKDPNYTREEFETDIKPLTDAAIRNGDQGLVQVAAGARSIFDARDKDRRASAKPTTDKDHWGPSNYTDADGKPLLVNSRNGDTKPVKGSPPAPKVTADERKMGLFSAVTTKELPKIEEMEKTYRPGKRAAAAGMIPGFLGGNTVGNYVMSDEDRAYDASARRILDPLLRSTTGANAPPAEVEDKRRAYFRLPGDDDATFAAKQVARREFIAGIIEAAGPAGKNKSLPDTPLSSPGAVAAKGKAPTVAAGPKPPEGKKISTSVADEIRKKPEVQAQFKSGVDKMTQILKRPLSPAEVRMAELKIWKQLGYTVVPDKVAGAGE